MVTDETLSQLVAIGASAGGIEALTVALATLPANFGAPIVIAQHLDPARASHLGDVLQRHSPLPVHTVVDESRMDPGVIYVVPADRDVEIADGHVRVLVRESGVGADASSDSGGTLEGNNPPAPSERWEITGVAKPSINRLLRSAAAAYGEGLIAVILTGLGADGAAGARDVKAAGGTVVIQNPATARFPAMPQSLAPTTVDIVAELEAIGPLLQELLSGPRRIALPEEDRRLRALLAQVREETGIDFGAYKTPTILRRLQRRMVATDMPHLADYLRYLQRNPEEYQRLASNFLIKVTGFFRDPELYQHLRDHVLPELVAEAHDRGNELRLWSAGCATGEEAYSLAMTVADALGDALERFTVRVFATDLDNGAVAFARRGVYPAQALKDVPPDLVGRYFTESDGEFTVRKRIRSLTVFGQHDLGQRAPFPRIDLALCRNVLIYFTPELQRRALQLFAFALRQGGYLALGKAETTMPLAEFFTLADARLKIYRREGDHALSLPAARIRDAAPQIAASAQARDAGATLRAVGGSNGPPAGGRRFPRPAAPRPATVGELYAVSERSASILRQLPVGVVVVDRRYDVQFINATARRLLGIHTPAIGEDFLHQLRLVSSAALRGALDAALGEPPDGSDEWRREEPPDGSDQPARSDEWRAQAPQPGWAPPAGAGSRVTIAVATAEPRTLHVECFSFRSGPDADPQALVVVTDGTTAAQARRALEQQLAEAEHAKAELERRHEEERERLTAQVQQLVESNRELLAANQELIEANTELHDQSEELLVGHEEAEAATEEVETLNEELQATNEEQETLNEELQSTVEELNTTNDDLEARSVELQELAASLEAERTRLQVVLDSLSDGLLVFDQRGVPVLANEAYRRMFGMAPEAGITLPLEGDGQGRLLPGEATLPALAARGERFTTRFTVTAPDGQLRWYEASGHPAPHGAALGGAVVTFRELADSPQQPGNAPTGAPAGGAAPDSHPGTAESV